MSDKDNGGPAFPVVADRGMRLENSEGISVRDYFAVHATEADIAAQAEVIRAKTINRNMENVLPKEWRTKARYLHADSMLKARQS